LMYGQPGQDLASLGSDLAAALHYVDKGLSHLSLYQFTIEPNTVFAKHAPACMPDEDLLESMQWLIESNLRMLALSSTKYRLGPKMGSVVDTILTTGSSATT